MPIYSLRFQTVNNEDEKRKTKKFYMHKSSLLFDVDQLLVVVVFVGVMHRLRGVFVVRCVVRRGIDGTIQLFFMFQPLQFGIRRNRILFRTTFRLRWRFFTTLLQNLKNCSTFELVSPERQGNALTCFFHFIRRFWYLKGIDGDRLPTSIGSTYQVFTCNWDKCNISASSIRSGVERYFCVSKRFSRPINWASERERKTISNVRMARRFYQRKLFVYGDSGDDE